MAVADDMKRWNAKNSKKAPAMNDADELQFVKGLLGGGGGGGGGDKLIL